MSQVLSGVPNAIDSTPDQFPNEFIDPIDGSKWETREQSPVAWPRLWNLSAKVTAKTQFEKQPGKIRRKKVPLLRPSSRNPNRAYPRLIWVFHADDAQELVAAPDYSQSFFDADRQLATNGKFKGQWFISPRSVAEKIGIDISLVPKYRKRGMPWMPKIAAGRSRGKKRKPITLKFKYGYYGRDEDFWLETEVDEFAKARKDLPEVPPEGYATITDADKNGDISKGYGREKRRSRELGFVEFPIKVPQRVKGKRDFAFTSVHRLLPQEQLNEFRNARIDDPVPHDRITIANLANVLRVAEGTIHGWIAHGTNHLNGAKPAFIRGPALCISKRSRRRNAQLKDDCYLLLKRQGRIIWKSMYPTRPVPKALEEVEISASLGKIAALVEAGNIVIKNTHAELKEFATDVGNNHAESLNKLGTTNKKLNEIRDGVTDVKEAAEKNHAANLTTQKKHLAELKKHLENPVGHEQNGPKVPMPFVSCRGRSQILADFLWDDEKLTVRSTNETMKKLGYRPASPSDREAFRKMCDRFKTYLLETDDGDPHRYDLHKNDESICLKRELKPK